MAGEVCGGWWGRRTVAVGRGVRALPVAHLGCMAMMSYLIFTLSTGCVASPPNSSFSPAVSDATRVRYIILHTAWGGTGGVPAIIGVGPTGGRREGDKWGWGWKEVGPASRHGCGAQVRVRKVICTLERREYQTIYRSKLLCIFNDSRAFLKKKLWLKIKINSKIKFYIQLFLLRLIS